MSSSGRTNSSLPTGKRWEGARQEQKEESTVVSSLIWSCRSGLALLGTPSKHGDPGSENSAREEKAFARKLQPGAPQCPGGVPRARGTLVSMAGVS